MQLEVIGKFIAKLRREKKLTQKQLGEMLNIDSKTISKWERGKYAPDMMLFRELGKLFEVSIEELLDGKRTEGKDVHMDEAESESDSTELIKKMKIKYSIITLVIVMFVVIIFFMIIATQKEEQLKVINITNTNSINYSLVGKIIYNEKKSIYVFGDFVYNDEKIETDDEIKIVNSKLTLIVNNEIVYANYKDYDEEISLHKAVQNFQINIEENSKIYKDGDDIKIRIEYQDIDMDEHSVLLSVK